MEDDRIVISSGLVVTPESVASRSFGTAFRGYNPDEVRAFLKRVAEELASSVSRQSELRAALQEALTRAAHPELDEAALTAGLGDHAARLLASAREHAASITSEASDRVNRLMRDAEEKVTSMRKEAEALMARRVEEAEAVASRLRRAAEADASAIRERAAAEAEAQIGGAQARGKEMVAEARAVRERMLSDLARRRRAAEVQIEQLRAGRERLVEAFEVVRRTVTEVTHELEVAEPEARIAAEEVGRRSVESAIPDRRDAFATALAGRPSRSDLPPGGVRPAGALAGLDLSGPGLGIAPPTRRPQAVAEVTDSPADSELATGETPAVGAQPAPPGENLEDLFARIRREREREREREGQREGQAAAGDQPGAGAGTGSGAGAEHGPSAPGDAPPATSSAENGSGDLNDPAMPQAGESEVATHAGAAAGAGSTPGTAISDETFLQRRDEALEPIEAGLARRLKRVLQDEQNEVLDTLRRQRSPAPLSALPDVAEQRARYRAATAELLSQAVVAGAAFAAGASGGGSPGEPDGMTVAGDVAGDLAAELVIGLRERIEAAIAQHDGSPGEDDPFSESISATYRQWKLEEVEPLARHHAHAAFIRGAFAAAPAGSSHRWVVDDDGPCPDCDDNVLAGPTPTGEAFPTGQPHPPAHAGCRCLLVAVLP